MTRTYEMTIYYKNIEKPYLIPDIVHYEIMREINFLRISLDNGSVLFINTNDILSFEVRLGYEEY